MKFRILEDTTNKEGVKYTVKKLFLFLWINLDGIRYISEDLAQKAIRNYLTHGKTNCIRTIETSEPITVINKKA